MDLQKAKILLENLLGRIESRDDGVKHLPGALTDLEMDALHTALINLDNEIIAPQTHDPDTNVINKQKIQPTYDSTLETESSENHAAVNDDEDVYTNIDLRTLLIEKPSSNIRLCLDFGTAMSKAALVNEIDNDEIEDIHVLKLGIPGNQEEISETMLISSIFIDDDGKLWFGKAAIDHSSNLVGDGLRQRLDNIKRRLSEEGWDEVVNKQANPTEIRVTHGDIVLAYLTFFTWTVNFCLEELGYPSNLPRRFAMPCFPSQKSRETVERLRQHLGDAQILADTFETSLIDGILLKDFVAAAKALRHKNPSYEFVDADITEPLGVASSLISWKARVDMLAMVIDIGAGTSDLSLYRVHFDPDKDENMAREIEGTARGLTEAGNHLDRILIELIIKKSGVTSADPMWVNVRGQLELEIRDIKESLFNAEHVVVPLKNGGEVEVDLQEFLSLDAVKRFGENLKTTMVEILDAIDESWLGWITANPQRYLTVVLTGGGAELPMVKTLAEGMIEIRDIKIPLQRALPFPKWLSEIDENLEADYPRVAVAIGGARRRIFERGAAAVVTAGDITRPPKLGGYFIKGA